MQEIKEKIIKFMASGYAVTKWPYFNLVTLKVIGKENTMPALLELQEEGKIAFRMGINERLIEYLP